jgi:RHS repeat-associated protein
MTLYGRLRMYLSIEPRFRSEVHCRHCADGNSAHAARPFRISASGIAHHGQVYPELSASLACKLGCRDRSLDLAVSGTDTDVAHFAQLDHDLSTSSGLEHAAFREYSSSAGRWMSPDPYFGSYSWKNPQSLNRYTYVQNRPLSAVDPDGLAYCAILNAYDPNSDPITTVAVTTTPRKMVAPRQEEPGYPILYP